MLLAQVTKRPDILALDEGEEVQSIERLAVPVQVRDEKVALLLVDALGDTEDDVFGFGDAVNDVEHPLKAALIALGCHVWAHLVLVDCSCLGDVADTLLFVFLDMLFGAGVDQVDLQILVVVVIQLVVDGAAGGHVPVVDVVGSEVLDGTKSCRDGDELGACWREGGTLEDENCREAFDLAEETDASSGLVWWVLAIEDELNERAVP